MSLPVPAEEPAFGPSDLVDRALLRATGPDEIVQLVPYLIGFHPADSLVLVALRGLRLVASVRNDLAAPLGLVEPVCVAATRAGADRVVAVIYSDDVTGHPLPRQKYVDDLLDLFDHHGLKAVDVIAVSNRRWWSYQCSSAECCPPEGTPVDVAGVVAAHAVSEGLVALPGRDDLRHELEPDQLAINLVRAEIEKLHAAEWARRVTVMAGEPTDDDSEVERRRLRASDWGLVRRFVREVRKRPTITPAQAAPVLLALLDKNIRDATLGYLSGRAEPELREAWRRLTTMAPTAFRAAPATLYATWCFASGSGARSNMGVDVALEADPDYTFAQLLLEMQASGLNPFEVVHDLADEAARVGRRIQRRRHPSGRRAP